MERKKENQVNKNKEDIIYKSRTPRKKKRLIILTILDVVSLLCFLGILYLLINTFIFINLPSSIIPITYLILGIFIFSFLFYTLTFLIVREFFSYLSLYERGIEILIIKFLPFKIRRKFIPYKDIKDVKIEKDDFNLKVLRISVNQKDPFELDEFDIADLQRIHSLILEYKNK